MRCQPCQTLLVRPLCGPKMARNPSLVSDAEFDIALEELARQRRLGLLGDGAPGLVVEAARSFSADYSDEIDTSMRALFVQSLRGLYDAICEGSCEQEVADAAVRSLWLNYWGQPH